MDSGFAAWSLHSDGEAPIRVAAPRNDGEALMPQSKQPQL